MKKTLVILAVSVLFLAPFSSYASTVDEQRQAILLQIITLLEEQIAVLQAQLAAQATSTPAVEATSTPSIAPVEVSPFTPGTWTCILESEPGGHVGRICGG